MATAEAPPAESEQEPHAEPDPKPQWEPKPEPEPVSIPFTPPEDLDAEPRSSRGRGRILVGAGMAGVLALVAVVAPSLGDGSGAPNTTIAAIAGAETTVAAVETTIPEATTTTAPTTTTTTVPLRDPEPLQVFDGVDGGSVAVRLEAGVGALSRITGW